MISVPRTYNEYINALEYLKKSSRNPRNVDIINQSTLEVDDTLRYRLANNIMDLIVFRLNKAVKTINDEFEYGLVKEDSLVINLFEVNREINYLLKYAKLDIFNDDIKTKINDFIIENANKIQDKLLDITKDYDDIGLFYMIVKNNPVNKFKKGD